MQYCILSLAFLCCKKRNRNISHDSIRKWKAMIEESKTIIHDDSDSDSDIDSDEIKLLSDFLNNGYENDNSDTEPGFEELDDSGAD